MISCWRKTDGGMIINAYECIVEQVAEATSRILPKDHSPVLRVYYRGHRNIGWEPTPVILRNEDPRVTEASEMERAQREGHWDRRASLFENIATIQHYGYKTRFLDFTTNLDVALYFACLWDKENAGNDGAVYLCCYSNDRTAASLDSAMISELVYLRAKTRVMDFAAKFADEYRELTSAECDSIGAKVLSWCDHGLMVTPSDEELSMMKMTNPRIARQRGAFFVFGNQTCPPSASASTVDARTTLICPKIAGAPTTINPNTYGSGAKTVCIPSAWKPEILLELAQKGITDEYLFPDGM